MVLSLGFSKTSLKHQINSGFFGDNVLLIKEMFVKGEHSKLMIVNTVLDALGQQFSTCGS